MREGEVGPDRRLVGGAVGYWRVESLNQRYREGPGKKRRE